MKKKDDDMKIRLEKADAEKEQIQVKNKKLQSAVRILKNKTQAVAGEEAMECIRQLNKEMMEYFATQPC